MKVKKRDGRIEEFDREKIYQAVLKAGHNGADLEIQTWIVHFFGSVTVIDVEDIHNEVERRLMQVNPEAAKRYILYRARHAELPVPDSNAISDYIHPAKYARFDKSKNRRETYSETVYRVAEMHIAKFPKLTIEIRKQFRDVYDKRCLPSMRSMQFSGAAIEQHNERMYNCSFTHVDRPEVFGQALYLLLCGCGVGYSVQKQHVDKLPTLKKIDKKKVQHLTVRDSIEGWGDALTYLIRCYTDWQFYVEFSYDLIRSEGTPLKTSGGIAPGHLPMKKMLENVRGVLNGAQGRKLKPIECHDIMCYVAECVLAGGIRRSSLIALFSQDDQEMLYCKTDQQFDFGKKNPQRALANNSVVLKRDETTKEEFQLIMNLNRWSHGEPGFFFCEDEDWGCNPCGEIMLYPLLETKRIKEIDLEVAKFSASVFQTGFAFCNLTEVNAAKCLDKETFLKACESAAAIGTLQATYMNFPYLGKISEKIAKRDALIGVSITGIQDNPKCMEWMKEGKEVVYTVNELWSNKLNIHPAKRTTCIKPSGTASLELGCVASGIHYHHAERYFRRIIANPNEEVAQYFKSINPHMVEEKGDDWYITFPVAAPRGVRTMKDYEVLYFLWEIFDVYDNWIDGHNISCTIVFKDDEWDTIIDMIWENRASIAAMTFLPASSDKQIPFMPREAVETEADEVKWKNLVDNFKVVDYTKMTGGEGTSFNGECERCAE